MSESKQPKPTMCWHCDFGSGQRGMDSCGKCDGTGSGYYVKEKDTGKLRFFPNTKQGYELACAAVGVQP